MQNLLIRNARVSDDRELQDIHIQDGMITAIAPNLDMQQDIEINAMGHVVLPTLIESHIHPDKAFLEDRKPNVSGTLDEAIKNTGELKAQYTYEDVKERAEKVIRWAVKNGTTIIRAHPDVDLIEKTLGVEVLLDIKEKYKEVLDLQIVAFPQEGILKSAGVLDLMEQSIQMGADVVGGCPYNEHSMEDTKRHIELVFDLAERYDLPVDMHVDFSDDPNDPQNTTTKLICEMTIERNMQGKVALGHVTTLGSLDPEVAAPIFEKIAAAGVTINPLPATDMFMNGRKDRKNIRRGMAPVQAMLQHGINIAYSSNNIRNAFTPYGNADLLAVGYLLAVSQQLGSPDLRREVLNMVTYNAAKGLGIGDTYGLEKGRKADLVIFNSTQLSDVINDQPAVLYVVKSGKVIVENQIETKLAKVLQSEDKK